MNYKKDVIIATGFQWKCLNFNTNSFHLYEENNGYIITIEFIINLSYNTETTDETILRYKTNIKRKLLDFLKRTLYALIDLSNTT